MERTLLSTKNKKFYFGLLTDIGIGLGLGLLLHPGLEPEPSSALQIAGVFILGTAWSMTNRKRWCQIYDDMKWVGDA